MASLPAPAADAQMPPNLAQPASIFDLLNFRVSEFLNLSGSLVTRLCEGEFGVTREEWQFIAMLAALGTLSPSELAARTTVDRSQGSRTLHVLLDKQLIYRERVAGDGRCARVRLSEAGWTLYRQAFPRVVAVHSAMLSELDEEELCVLARCLSKMQATAMAVKRSDLVEVQADRRHGGSRSTWVEIHRQKGVGITAASGDRRYASAPATGAYAGRPLRHSG